MIIDMAMEGKFIIIVGLLNKENGLTVFLNKTDSSYFFTSTVYKMITQLRV
jgi:hypothetical protein